MSAEELANRELENIRSKGALNFPINPFEILHDAGVDIVLKDFDDLAGIIINDEDNYTVVGINKNNSLQRQRFTAAHEYCHYIKDLKRQTGSMDCIKCLNKSDERIEKYADNFAGYFLMPTYELKRMCEMYKDNEGYVEWDKITIIAEYFGVSFSACLHRIAYGLHLIDGDTLDEALNKRMKEYGILSKRREIIKNQIDNSLLANVIDSMSFIMPDINNYTGQKFLQDYIFNDNRLEKVVIDRKKLNFILADLNYNGTESKYFKSDDEAVIMTLGNLELQKYVINTNDEISLKKCGNLHSILYKYTPFSEYAGRYRNASAMIRSGAIQPAAYYEIYDKINALDEELQLFLKEKDNYKISKYIEKVAYFVYNFVVIHPFQDGNGRISRALLNWLLKVKNIPPIYIDYNCRNEYYAALAKIDKEGDYTLFAALIEKRVIHSMILTNKYLFVDEIDDKI